MEESLIAKPICDILRKLNSEDLFDGLNLDQILSEISDVLIRGKNESGNL